MRNDPGQTEASQQYATAHLGGGPGRESRIPVAPVAGEMEGALSHSAYSTSGIPVADTLNRPPERLVEMVFSAFPNLVEKEVACAR